MRAEQAQMKFLPFDRMRSRVDATRSDSDVATFHDLLYFGEFVVKATVAGLVAAIQDDPEALRYRQLHRLVRADGVGEWASVAYEVLFGPPSHHLVPQIRETHVALTTRSAQDTWQYKAAAAMGRVWDGLSLSRPEKLPDRVQGNRWLTEFAELRNKTRGHGAPLPGVAARVVPDLEDAINTMIDGLPLFSLPWAHLHQNLSGKYRVSCLTPGDSKFKATLHSDSSSSLPDGVYLLLDVPRKVDLLVSDPDLLDFFSPNGGFRRDRHELLSYITGATRTADASTYLAPAAALPRSETQGLGDLDVQGSSFGNLPASIDGYVVREQLEGELERTLLDDRHPVVTLHGPGGIGKTSIALAVLHRIASTERFPLILWFSARDIDLLPQGPKPVRPAVVSETNIADEYIRLVGQPKSDDERRTFRNIDHFGADLTESPHGPTLFVFDNFETVQSPTDLFQWLDTRIRLPNKVLITTRFREFKGDYPVAVSGMAEEESLGLMRSVSRYLGIGNLVTDGYMQDVYRESSGHPYVMKILLGEVAKAQQLVKLERIVASSDQILTALFERTYRGLSPAAQRVFFTVCNWRSMIPLIGLKAVVLRKSNERVDVDAAIDSLERSSFIELVKSELDGELFVKVPLAAAVYGRRKLQVNPMKTAVEADCRFLREFGAIQEFELRRGLRPRVQRLFRCAAQASGPELDDFLSILELVANSYPVAWLLLADLYDELRRDGDAEREKLAVLKYLESPGTGPERSEAWQRLAAIARRIDDVVLEVHALVELSIGAGVGYHVLSDSANRVNTLLRRGDCRLEGEEKSILIKKLAAIMTVRVSEADATALSRLAWLCLHLREDEAARSHTRCGLQLDPNNVHCRKLAERLQL